MSELRDIPFQELLNQTAEHCGLDSERLSVSEGRGLATFLTTACREMLRENDWPGIVVTERRVCDAGALFTAGTTAYAYAAVVRETIDDETTFWRCISPIAEVSDEMNGVDIADVSGTGTRTISVATSSIENAPKVGDILYSVTDAMARITAIYTAGIATVFVIDADLPSATVGTLIRRSPRPSETPVYWEAYTAPLRIAYEQTGKTPMLDILAIYESDPASTTSPAQASYTLDDTGILLDPASTADVWIQFRKPSPRFSIALYSSSKAYVVGDLAVAWPHCYRCIQAGTDKTPATEPTYWQAQTLPEKVGESASLYAAEKWQRSLSKYAEASALRGEREDALDRASRVRNRQEGQTRTYSVATRFNSPANNYRPRRAALR